MMHQERHLLDTRLVVHSQKRYDNLNAGVSARRGGRGGNSPGERALRIGRGLQHLGDANPSDRIEIEEFDVTLSNRYFKSEGPLLLSKDGRVLYACAPSASDEVHIPEGVERIGYGALYGATAANVTDVYVPDSVVHIEESAFSSKNPSLTLHCSLTCETALFAKGHNIACEQ